ncbi:MAG TPA: O-antigen ligase family protein [Solirubrobacteraceae bacterium]
MLTFLKRHRLVVALLIVSTLAGALAAKVNTRGDLTVAAATTHLLIDDPNPSIVDRLAIIDDLATLAQRAVLYGRLMTTPPVIADIAKRARLPADQIAGIAKITAGEPHSLLQIRAEERANQIRVSLAPYRLELQPSPTEPVLTIYTETPSVATALDLANASIPGLRDYLRTVARQEHFPLKDIPQLRQLGNARGGVSHSSAKLMIGGLTFATVFLFVFFGLWLPIRRPWRSRKPDPPPSGRTLRVISARSAADWPRTTRLMPWTIALFIAMIWLTPFDRIQLTASGPVNMTLDRLLLPVIAVMWLLARAAGPAARPRVRITKMHVAIAVYVAIALLSVVLDARYINHTGDFMLSIKKLPLLVTYVLLFVLVASSVRRTEVPAFLKYTLVLAVLCGIEVIYEYHFKENLFIVWTQRLIHSPFELTSASDGAELSDSLGRAWVVGPTNYGVELIAMMSTILPVPILGILGTKSRGKQLLYSLAIIVLVSAMFATQRKSALVLPAAVVLMLLYYRRRQLIALAPLAMIMLVMVALISPGIIHGLISQYTAPGSAHVATVSDRTADYDAVRPDVWSHLMFGRGFGSYDPLTYRVLDSEILGPLVETGVFGLLAYLMIGVSLILFARKPAASREPRLSTAALVGVAAGICMLVASVLYDYLGFPHGAYTFLYVAGLAVAAIRPGARGVLQIPPKHAARGHARPRRPLPTTSNPARRGSLPLGSP